MKEMSTAQKDTRRETCGACPRHRAIFTKQSRRPKQVIFRDSLAPYLCKRGESLTRTNTHKHFPKKSTEVRQRAHYQNLLPDLTFSTSRSSTTNTTTSCRFLPLCQRASRHVSSVAFRLLADTLTTQNRSGTAHDREHCQRRPESSAVPL